MYDKILGGGKNIFEGKSCCSPETFFQVAYLKPCTVTHSLLGGRDAAKTVDAVAYIIRSNGTGPRQYVGSTDPQKWTYCTVCKNTPQSVDAVSVHSKWMQYWSAASRCNNSL